MWSRSLKTVITHHLGLGDHIVCVGLYRQLALERETITLAVKARNAQALRDLLSGAGNVRIVSFPNVLADFLQVVMALGLGLVGYSRVNLGAFGGPFLSDNSSTRFDEVFYEQAEVEFSHRWDSFSYLRNLTREQELFESTGLVRGEYVFLHEDLTRGFRIERSRLPKEKGVFSVTPSPRWHFLDYVGLIENAAEIHCIESSFAALIESLEISVPKYIHRYARPEAVANPRQEFSLKSGWMVLS